MSTKSLTGLVIAASDRIQERAYWLNALAGIAEETAFPDDFEPEAPAAGETGSFAFSLPGPLCTRLNTLCNGSDQLLLTALLAGLTALLTRYTGRRDVSILTPVYGPATEEPVLNQLLVVRSRVENDSFKTLLGKVRTTLQQAAKHRNYPFEVLVRQLTPDHAGPGPRLFGVSLVLDNLQAEEALPVPPGMAFRFLRTAGGITGSVRYNAARYRCSTAERVAGHFCRLLHACLAAADQPLGSLDILSDEDRQVLLEGFNHTAPAYPSDRTMSELFEARAAATPEAVAVVDATGMLTYGQLNARANRLARHLKAHCGLGPEAIAAFVADRSRHTVVCMLAILKAGAAYLPLEAGIPRERAAYLLRNTGAKVLLTGGNAAAWSGYGDICPVIAPEECRGQHEAGASGNLPAAHHARNLAYVIFTSGSTGQPKGVMVEHRSVVRLMSMPALTTPGPAIRLLQTAPLAFDASTFEIWGPLLHGGQLHLTAAEDVMDVDILREMIRSKGINAMWLTTALFNGLADADPAVFRPLRYLVAGGEALSVKHVNQVRAACPGVQLINGYGPTENTTFSLSYEVNRTHVKSIPLGTPIPNSTAYVLDEARKLVPVGVTGQICVGGHGVARGYVNEPELTAEKFFPNPFVPGDVLYQTGDLGYWTPEGQLIYQGRNDNQVKLRGFRIEPGEIENRLVTHKSIRKAVVEVKPNRDGEQVLVAYLETAEKLRTGALVDFLKVQLPEYMIPARFVLLEAMPVTANGKTDRKALPDPEAVSQPGEAACEPPRDATEKKLVEIWQQVLQRERVDMHDNFFDIGGHSLKLIQVVSAVYKELGVKIGIRDVVMHPTARELCGVIKRRPVHHYEHIPAVSEQPWYDLSEAQKRLWVLFQLNPQHAGYNVPSAYRFEGAVDRQALARAFEALVARHEILRTNFVVRQGEPRQVIKSPGAAGFRLQFADLRTAADPAAEAATLTTGLTVAPFDLESDCLIRAALLQLHDRQFEFLLVLHHIVSDGWSLEILFREVLALYNAFRAGKESPLHPLKIHYKDYAAWHNRLSEGEKSRAQEAYWQTQLEGNWQAIRLPYDFPAPQATQPAAPGKMVTIVFGEAEAAALDGFCRRHQLSLFSALVGAVYLLLHYHSAQDDLVVGIPVTGRHHPDLQDQIGFYVNMLLLRERVGADTPVLTFLQRVKDTVTDALDNQDVPYSRLTEMLKQARGGTENLFNVEVDFHEFDAGQSAPDAQDPGFTARPFAVDPNMDSKFDLAFVFNKNGKELSLNFQYNTRRFRAATGASLGTDICWVINQMTASAHLSVARFTAELAAREQGRKQEQLQKQRSTRLQRLEQLGLQNQA